MQLRVASWGWTASRRAAGIDLCNRREPAEWGGIAGGEYI